MSYKNKVRVLHFSDLHFGDGHRFNSEDKGAPNLTSTILSVDEIKKDNDVPTIIVATGDFVQGKTVKEERIKDFEKAKQFLVKLNGVISKNCLKSEKNIYLVPGNHDIIRNDKTENRFRLYNDFYKSIHKKIPGMIYVKKDEKNKLIIAEINSNSYGENDIYIEKGMVDLDTLKDLRNKLVELHKESDFKDYIKIALLHHHIVQLPPFLKNYIKKENKDEKDEKYLNDSIEYGADLLNILNEFKFHLVLHGHKHLPCQYLHDTNYYLDEESPENPILIIAGGSCGCADQEFIKTGEDPKNTFNIVELHWNSESDFRIDITVKGLEIKKKGRLISLMDWKWTTIKNRVYEFKYNKIDSYKLGWKITIIKGKENNTDKTENLKICLQNCLLEDMAFLDTEYPNLKYDNKNQNIFTVSDLKYGLIVNRVKQG